MERGSEEEVWCKRKHLENNCFAIMERRPSRGGEDDDDDGGGSFDDGEQGEGDGGTRCFIQGEDVRVVVVEIRQGRIADWKGGVKDWRLVSGSEGQRGRVNGVS